MDRNGTEKPVSRTGSAPFLYLRIRAQRQPSDRTIQDRPDGIS